MNIPIDQDAALRCVDAEFEEGSEVYSGIFTLVVNGVLDIEVNPGPVNGHFPPCIPELAEQDVPDRDSARLLSLWYSRHCIIPWSSGCAKLPQLDRHDTYAGSLSEVDHEYRYGEGVLWTVSGRIWKDLAVQLRHLSASTSRSRMTYLSELKNSPVADFLMGRFVKSSILTTREREILGYE